MLNKVIEWSGKNPFLILLATLFVVIAGVIAVMKTLLDALPDLSDVQVIVYTEYPGQAPQVVEDQVTSSHHRDARGAQVEGRARLLRRILRLRHLRGRNRHLLGPGTRVLEYPNFASGRLPKGVTPTLGPDATGIGWVYQYVLLAKDRTLAELRAIQDW